MAYWFMSKPLDRGCWMISHQGRTLYRSRSGSAEGFFGANCNVLRETRSVSKKGGHMPNILVPQNDASAFHQKGSCRSQTFGRFHARRNLRHTKLMLGCTALYPGQKLTALSTSHLCTCSSSDKYGSCGPHSHQE